MTKSLAEMTSAELRALSAEIADELEKRRASELLEARERVRTLASETGFSLAELTGEPSKSRKREKVEKTGTVAPKYRDPSNPANTWTGRGRVASWLADYEKAGRKREEFLAS
jgi:DNA-binding protein H-NS